MFFAGVGFHLDQLRGVRVLHRGGWRRKQETGNGHPQQEGGDAGNREFGFHRLRFGNPAMANRDKGFLQRRMLFSIVAR